MKIPLSLTSAQLIYLAARLGQFAEENLENFVLLPKREKVLVSITLEVADKLNPLAQKANRPKAKKPKNHHLTFKYHEASAIQSYTLLAKDKETDPYIKNVALQIYTKIDEKL